MPCPKAPAADYRPYAFAILEAVRDRGALDTLHAPALIAVVHHSGGLTLVEIAEYLGATPEDVLAAYHGNDETAEVAA
ncbi:hypothetical protein [Nocardia africana]